MMMKKKIAMRTALTVLLGLAALLVPSFAQEEDFMKAEIPFEFVVHGKTFPAGTYKVEVGPGPGEAPVLAIQTAYESQDELRFRKVFTSTIPLKDAPPPEQPRLVFKKVGDLHFLEKVVPPTGDVKEVR